MDDHSLTISYDAKRGDHRGGKGAADEGRCLDCNWCVQVCPQGIDIRDGFQLECIACGRCVDACTTVMLKASPRTRTLVNYDTVANSKGQSSDAGRARTRIYGALLVGLSIALVAVLATRADFEVTVNRVPGTMFQLDGDQVRNTYMMRLTNNSAEAQDYALSLQGIDGASFVVPPIALDPNETRQVPLVVVVPRTSLSQASTALTVVVSGEQDDVHWSTTFMSPRNEASQ